VVIKVTKFLDMMILPSDVGTSGEPSRTRSAARLAAPA
jgi:hypothetical protein